MRRFLAGFLVGAILLLLTVALVARFGFADVRADAPIPSWFASWFAASVHRSVRRQAAVIDSLPPASDAEIIAGGKLYLLFAEELFFSIESNRCRTCSIGLHEYLHLEGLAFFQF